MLALLILVCYINTAISTNSNVLKFAFYGDKVDLGDALDYHIDIRLKDTDWLYNSVIGQFREVNGSLQGSSIIDDRNASSVAIITLENPKIRQDTIAVALERGYNGHMKISTDQYKFKLSYSSLPRKQLQLLKDDLISCSCVPRECACCSSVRIPDFHHDICVNATYNNVTIGLDLSIGIDGHFYTVEISARNPPPICLSIPYAHDLVSICLAFTDLDISRAKKTLSGCVELEAELLRLRVIKVHLGCFVMPI